MTAMAATVERLYEEAMLVLAHEKRESVYLQVLERGTAGAWTQLVLEDGGGAGPWQFSLQCARPAPDGWTDEGTVFLRRLGFEVFEVDEEWSIAEKVLWYMPKQRQDEIRADPPPDALRASLTLLLNVLDKVYRVRDLDRLFVDVG